MVVELAAVIAGVNTAASAIKKAAEVGQDLQTVARKAEHARQAAALRRRKQNLKYLVQFCMFMLGILIIVPIMIWLVITLAS